MSGAARESSEAADLARRAARILEEVIELTPDARDAVTARICGDDDALRRRVEDLLRADALAAEFLETPAIESYGELLDDGPHASDPR
jgi:hypothetical protein